MASRRRGSVQVRGSSISVVLDLGEQPWRRCPTPKCQGSVFSASTTSEACEHCGALLEAPRLQRRRVWHSGFKTKAEANKALTKMLGERDEGSFTPPAALTVREFVEKTWLPGLDASGLRPSTVELYRGSVRRHVLPQLAAARLRDVTPGQLVQWLAALKAAGVGDRTVAVAGITAHKLLKSALDLELIARNPADNAAVRQARPKAKAPEPTTWTPEQTRAFLDSQREDRLFALWRLAAMTGMRRGELAGTRWSDIDLETGALTVRATRVVVDYRVVESEPKTEASRRTIGLDAGTVAALRQHRARQAAERLAAGELWATGDYVFADELGRPYHPDILTKTLARRARAVGLPVVKLHALRHGHATHALEVGVPLKVVSERLGHSSIKITGDVYSHVSAAVDQAAAAQVAALVDGS